MKKFILLLIISLVFCFCSCSAKDNSVREDLVFVSESGKYVDELGNEINFSEDIYSVGLNYIIGWDVETLSPVKIYKGDKINGFRVSEIDSQYLFYNPMEVDIYGTVSEFADKTAPLFFHSQSCFFNIPEEAVHGYFIFDNDTVIFYPEYSEEENFYYLHNPQYLAEEDFEFTYNGEIKIQPFGMYCRVENEDGTWHMITKEDIKQTLGIDLPEAVEYLEADVYFNWFCFETHKSNASDPPLKTNAYGNIKKIIYL